MQHADWYFDFISPFSYLQFVIDYLEDPAVLDDREMQRISELPIGTARK